MADLKFLVDDWPAISRRLDEALSLPAAERDTWLDALHEPNGLKAALKRLLAEAVGKETGDFLESLPRLTLDPHDASPAGGDDDAAAGLVVGAYRLIRQLGVGGMGTVWLAERVDGGLKRQVAVKLPRASWARGLAERMTRERDILASLDHPNIARIYDAGLDAQGRPYLALEYVDGEPIDACCKRLSLSIADRLALIVQVARAVAHAHARLVVHRDLKPANILVTSDGQVRLLDFGIAKLMEGNLTKETALTMQAGRALTLDYASPEQIRGEPIGTASDVYSLGVVAYELLAEARPYQLKRQSAAALEEAIASVDAPLASAAAQTDAARKALRGDLDAILNKAMKKSVGERYPTVEAFAQDIERHLARLPVQARPDAVGYRARRFVSRNKLAVGAAAAVSVSLLVGLSAALWQARVATAQAERAEQVKNFALSIFESADTDAGAGAATTAADLLQIARRRIETESAGGREVEVELRTAVAYGLLGQGRGDAALQLMTDTVAMARRDLGPGHPRTVSAIVVYAEALSGADRPDEVVAVLKPVVAEARRLHADHDTIDALRWIAIAENTLGHTDAAIESAQAAVQAASASTRRADARDLKIDARNVYATLARILLDARRGGAADAQRRALALTTELYGDTVSRPTLAARMTLGEAMLREGKTAAALVEMASVVEATRKFLGPQHPDTRMVTTALGNARLEIGDAAGAIEPLQTALDAAEAEPGAPAVALGIHHLGLATALAKVRRDAEALPHLASCERLLRQAAGIDGLLAWRCLSARALLLTRLGRYGEAEGAFAALAGAPVSAPETAANLGRLAWLRSLEGRHEDAVALAERAAEGLRSLPSNARNETFVTQGKVLLAAGRAAEAKLALKEAVAGFAKREKVVSADQSDALALLARAESAAPAESSTSPRR